LHIQRIMFHFCPTKERQGPFGAVVGRECEFVEGANQPRSGSS